MKRGPVARASLYLCFVILFCNLRRWWSGQSQQTVNLSPFGLRWFKSSPAHTVVRMEAKASFRRSMVRVLFSSNRLNCSLISFSPFLRTENQECKLTKTFLSLSVWFQPILESISFLVWSSPVEKAKTAFFAK